MMHAEEAGVPRFEDLFDTFRDEAFRLETLPVYDTAGENSEQQRYAAGAFLPEAAQPTAWTTFIADRVKAGGRLPHVRLVTEPLTLYLRSAVDWYFPYQAQAGRDIRILAPGSDLAAEARRVGDYWLFDEATVALLRYDGGGSFLGADVIEDVDAVADYVRLRDRLLAAAVPFPEWLAAWRQRAR